MASSTKIGEPVLMMDTKVCKDKTLAEGLIERPSSILDEIGSKTVHKDKPFENIRKNLQSFLEISLVQKEVFPLHKL